MLASGGQILLGFRLKGNKIAEPFSSFLSHCVIENAMKVLRKTKSYDQTPISLLPSTPSDKTAFFFLEWYRTQVQYHLFLVCEVMHKNVSNWWQERCFCPDLKMVSRDVLF